MSYPVMWGDLPDVSLPETEASAKVFTTKIAEVYVAPLKFINLP